MAHPRPASGRALVGPDLFGARRYHHKQRRAASRVIGGPRDRIAATGCSLDRDGIDVTLEANFARPVSASSPYSSNGMSVSGARRLPQECCDGGQLHIASHCTPLVPERPLNGLELALAFRCRTGDRTRPARHDGAFRRLADDPAPVAADALARSRALGWRGVLAAHETAWAERWHLCDVKIEGDEAAQQALRFAIYHLNSAANPDDERVSIGARALTGDAYLGHVFWDTEIYLLPFFTLTWPSAARTLLMYRYHTLDAARAKATREGFRGALYAWELADTGEETTPPQLVGRDGRPIEVLCGSKSSTSAPISRTRFSTTGMQPVTSRSFTKPERKYCSKQPGSGSAAPNPRRTGTAISVASSGRTNITSTSMTMLTRT